MSLVSRDQLEIAIALESRELWCIYYQNYIRTFSSPPALSLRAPYLRAYTRTKVKTTIMIAILAACLFYVALAIPNDQIEKYENKVKSYQLDVPGRNPITIIETAGGDDLPGKWDLMSKSDDDLVIKNLMTHVVHDVDGNRPRCYGPSCQEGFVEDEGPQEFEEKLKEFGDFSNERLQAIAALAAKLKKQKNKADRFSTTNGEEAESDNNGQVFTSWNRLKVKQHKHPYDDKDGWVTLEPIAWSSSKISKWKPNVKKQKPTYWNDDEDTKYSSDDNYSSYQDPESDSSKYTYNFSQKKPTLNRPGFINNKLHIPTEYDMEVPSKPTWNKKRPTIQHSMDSPQMTMLNLQSSWSPDDSRHPNKPNCDKDIHQNEDNSYYGSSDSVITDYRPSNFPYNYEALHQSSMQRRPMRRPTQVIYADAEPDEERLSRPPYGDGQWVLLSTTKGYKNKKRHRALDLSEENMVPTITSHQSIALTVLPSDDAHTNMTTSHGGLLEVEKSFQTVEESKRDMDKKYDLQTEVSDERPVKKKILKKKVLATSSPDSSTVLAAVGAGMLPATMAMVVPMMLGKKRRRRAIYGPQLYQLQPNE
ncbi:unnamed protein product [Pieris brassicae]|uniref:Uncharacterized protein n=1 Tax=Pieris brassicae TaxID=7116 RepID=A0A9P0XH26_PIEBR|nr:unnamed protein product [Pieris brassicae]